MKAAGRQRSRNDAQLFSAGLALLVCLGTDLRAQFAILYQIADFSAHNEWRRVRVLLKSPRLTARTIGGYFAP